MKGQHFGSLGPGGLVGRSRVSSQDSPRKSPGRPRTRPHDSQMYLQLQLPAPTPQGLQRVSRPPWQHLFSSALGAHGLPGKPPERPRYVTSQVTPSARVHLAARRCWGWRTQQRQWSSIASALAAAPQAGALSLRAHGHLKPASRGRGGGGGFPSAS